jgi:phosphatidylserine/phosphatidylglycerophosphate/cardiolipin synthase-like enzyme
MVKDLDMAKFLDTTGISYRLQQIINNANERLILISPYLKINDRIKQSLEIKDKFKIDIRIIYGKNELQPTEHNWLKSLTSIRTSFCKDLHAKCYLNEKEAIITSMNLYDFSQVNNYEMGIYIDKGNDVDLYADIYKEVTRLILTSDEIKISVSSVSNTSEKLVKSNPEDMGYCIRCHSKIKLNPKVPYCKSCYSFWKIDKNEEKEEKNCHICGKFNKSTLLKPTCYDCFKANKNTMEFPLA